MTFLHLLVFALPRLAGIAALGLLAHAVGRRLTRGFLYVSGWERWSFATALGLGVLSTLLLAIAALQLLTLPAVLAALLAAGAAAGPAWAEIGRDLRRLPSVLAGHRAGAGAAALLVLLALPAAGLALHPPSGWDATMYHLASAQRYVRHHGLVFAPEIRFNWFPQAGEMLFTLPLLLGDDVSPALLELLMTALAGAALVAWGKRVFSGRAGLWACAFWLSSPLVVWIGSMAYVDAGAALFVLLGAYAAANWAAGGQTGWVVLSGAMLGYAAATKPTTLIPVGLAAGALAAAALRRRKPADLLPFAAAFLAAAGPWTVRCGLATGDPFYPLLAALGNGLAGPLNRADLLLLRRQVQGGPGMIPSLRAFLSLPYTLIFEWKEIGGEAPISPAFLLALPLAAIGATRDRRIRGLLLFLLLFLALWFLSARNARFLLPALPFAALAAGASLDLAFRRLPRHDSAPADRGVAFAAAALVLLPAVLFASLVAVKKGLPPTSAAAREDRLAILPAYRSVRSLNRAAGRDYTVYALFAENMSYFCDGRLLGDWFGPDRFADVLPALRSSRELHRKLSSFGAGYFLVNRRRLAELAPGARLPHDAEFSRLFERISTDGEADLYRVAAPTPGSPAPGSGKAAPGA